MAHRPVKDVAYWAKVATDELGLWVARRIFSATAEQGRSIVVVQPQNKEWTLLEFKVVFPEDQRNKGYRLSDKRIALSQIRGDEHRRGLPDQRAPRHTITMMHLLKEAPGVSDAAVTEDCLYIMTTEGANAKDVRRAVVHVLRRVFDWKRHPIVHFDKRAVEDQAA